MTSKFAKAAGTMVLCALAVLPSCRKDPDLIIWRQMHRPIHDTLGFGKNGLREEMDRKTFKAEPMADTIMKDSIAFPFKPLPMMAAPDAD